MPAIREPDAARVHCIGRFGARALWATGVSFVGVRQPPFAEPCSNLDPIARSVDGVKAVIDAKVLDHVLLLLKSPNLDTRKWACALIGNTARHSFTAPAILNVYPSVQLVSLLGAEDSFVPWVTYALSQIARWVDGAKAIIEAKVLDHVLPLLESSNPDTRKWACELVGNLAGHKSTAPTILKLNPSVLLVSWLCGEDSFAPWVTYALSRIARWKEGAKALVDAKALDHVLPLLESPSLDTRRWACELSGNLASHKSTASAILKLNPSVLLVSLLGDEDSLVPWVMYALSQIAQRRDGAKGVVSAKVLDHVLPLLESPNPDTRRWACELSGNLASHKSTAPAILKSNPSVLLVSLLGDEDSLVPWVTYALSQIARWEEGAKAVVDAKALDHVLPLLKSPIPDTQRWACELIENLASHESTASKC
ncbi:armadillo-type protein [Mycena albidolilacea]|uniref:Armadillo-type protein n=1 Tax=Mycena albidolilacea TaxID=1033008 RepID=A0AAD7EWU2_9AGAR|nr:armadillo-type protein [Mycena albidolilacea]